MIGSHHVVTGIVNTKYMYILSYWSTYLILQVFQQRKDGSVNFYRNWETYKAGFGTREGEHWLGNEHIHLISSRHGSELRVELVDFNDTQAVAEYAVFRISDEADFYRLNVAKYKGGSAGQIPLLSLYVSD